MARIVGLLLVRNEDLYIQWVIDNILDFCDHIVVLDNYSTDHTWRVLEHLAGKTDKISLRKWDNAQDSQKAVSPYYGTDTWIFGVDGDEVFDPSGLIAIRKRLLDGEFDHVWNVGGNFLNCVSVDLDAQTADGYLAPPAKQGVKLYNFKLVKGWENEEVERLHGHVIFSKDPVVRHLFLGNTTTWEEADLRCLHLCFMQRSSSDASSPVANLKRRVFQKLRGDSLVAKSLRWMKPLGSTTGPRSSIRRNAKRRVRNYAVGNIATVDIHDFRPPASTVGTRMR